MSEPRASRDLDLTATQLLARDASSGDLSRFDELYERVAPALFGWAALQIAPTRRGRLEPDEIVQETWLRALRHLGEFDPELGHFRAWLFGFAKLVLLEALRDLSRAGTSERNASERRSQLSQVPASITSVTRRVAREDGIARFLERVGALGEEERALTILRGLEGLSFEDVGLRLNLAPETVKKRWQRLRAELIARDLPRDLLADPESP
jgi:RNA polymerase sigma-70 factor (ECF subfamily)